MYSNAGNLIIPIVSFVLGEEWVVFSTAFLTVQLFFLWSHGVRLFSSDESFRIKKVVCNVNIIAIILGIIMMLANISLRRAGVNHLALSVTAIRAFHIFLRPFLRIIRLGTVSQI